MSDFKDRIAKLPPERLALLAVELKDRLDRAERELGERHEPIAIVGIGCRFPGGGRDPDSYWRSLAEGVDAVREVPAERWNLDRVYDADPDAPGKVGTRWGGFLDDVDRFDATLFGIAPREAAAVDPQQRLLLEVVWEALEDGDISPDKLAGQTGGVYVGLCNHDYQELMLERPLANIDAHIASGSAGSMAAGRVSYALGLQGPAITIDTACSSSLVALHLACESLRNRESNLGIAAGVNLILGVTTTVGLTKAHMISPDGRCRAFDERANGIVRGEGCGVLVLKRLADALAAGDRIHALIRATAVNQDGRSSGITAPNGPAQEALMKTALERARLRADQVDYIETHGTGTRLGDPIEVRAIGAVYGERGRSRPLLIGSVKTNLGHLEAAAGVAGVLKVVLALKHRQLPPHLHLQTRNPLIEWDRWPIEIPTRAVAWGAGAADAPRRGAVSSFGFSGTNAHVILEEAPAPAIPEPQKNVHSLLTMSARTPTALRSLAERYATALEAGGEDRTFVEFCAAAAEGRARFAHRAAVVAADAPAAADALRGWLAGRPAPVVVGRSMGQLEPVFLFTGQGSQAVDMGRALFESEPVFRAAFERCDAAFRAFDVRLIDTVFPSAAGSADASARILATRHAQPALFALELALAEQWRSWGVEPAAVAGHSVGEYAAAVVAGILDVESACRLLAARALAMDRLPSGGTMAAILASAEVVEQVLDGSSVEIAAYNSPANVVITGLAGDVGAALEAFAKRGIETRPLQVSHAFHSRALDPMLPELERAAAAMRFAAPEIPFFSTLTGTPIDLDTLGRASYWSEQARRPVRFAATLAALRAAGHSVFVEIGPHPTLCGLGMVAEPEASFLPSLRRGGDDRAELLKALAALHVRGVEPLWPAIFGRQRKVKIPGYPFERSSHWLGWSARAHGHAPAAPAAAPPRDADVAAPHALWRRDWIPLEGRGGALAAPRSIADAIEPRVAALVAEHGGDVYREFLPRLDALCSAYVVRALQELGCGLRVGDTVDAERVRKLGVLPAHAKLVRRMLEMLAEDGILEPSGESQWRVVAVVDASGADAMFRSVLADFPTCRAETELTGRCAARLADVLRGDADPMEILFPAGSLEQTEQLYADTPSFRVFNTLVAEAVAAASRGRTGLRVLEIGAGTGGTAAKLLPLLADKGARYTFTDVSSVFLERAAGKFAAYDFVEYRTLDASRDPRAQGFEPGAYDVVVASNVLHATPDLGVALEHVRALLAPGGLLVMLEGLRPQRFGDLTVGLTPGWWHFKDSLRPSYALLDADRWMDGLRRSRFEEATVVPRPHAGVEGLPAQQGVIIARVPDAPAVARDAARSAVTRWLALSRKGAPSERLARALADAGVGIELADASADAFDVGAAIGAFVAARADRGVLHLLALDETSDARDDGAAALARQKRSTGSALAAAQAAVLHAVADTVYVTHASAGLPGDTDVEPAGASISGLVRTLAVEHPEVRVRAVDVPSDWSSSAVALARILLSATGVNEDEIALRGEAALAPRVVAHSPRPSAPPAFERDASYIVTGGLAGLGLEVARWLVSRGAGRLVLSGRRPPTEAAAAVLENLRARGADVVVVTGDVADAANATALLDAAGPARLKGVFHAAGTTADASLLRQDWTLFERVMQAKVAGAWNLHRVTRELPLDYFVLFSTGAAFLGSLGQANHAAANAFMGGLAAARRARGLAGLSIDWGAWTEVGAATRGDVLERAGASGLGLIEPAAGLAMLGQLLHEGVSRVAAIPLDWTLFLERHPQLRTRALFADLAKRAPATAAAPAVAAANRHGALAERILAAAASSRRALLQDGLHDSAAKALGLGSGDQIDPRVPLTELGLDSLMAVELRNALAAQIGRPLPATLLFSYPTLDELTDHLLQELGVAASDVATPAAPDDLDAIDEAALAALLERKLAR